MRTYKAGLIGCGDFLRWEVEKINASKFFKLKYTFDVDSVKSKKRAADMNAQAVDSAETIFQDKEIEIVLIFTPPWIRKPYFESAVKYRKHIITTKPLAPTFEEAKNLFSMVNGKINCAVFYGRTGNAAVEKLKKIFDSGEIGKLALYKEDWFHHYPQWNTWATDPKKNGGPFMDAMIHNLNKSRYLIGDKVNTFKFYSENLAQKLKCNDTEFLKVNFKNGASSFLFITWAADLQVFSKDGNDREHIGISHLITNQGWYVTEEREGDESIIKAKKEDQIKKWKIEPLAYTPYDEFVLSVENKTPVSSGIEDAMEDIRILDAAFKSQTVLP
jgi:predicted dehydrogenase